MKITYLVLLSLFLATTFIQVSAQNEADIVYCDPRPDDFDPETAICTLEYNPVCAYVNGSNSGSTAGNPCQGCVSGDFYTLGACEEDEGGNVEEEQGGSGNGNEQAIVYCDPKPADFDPETAICTLEWNPVCAYVNGSNSGSTAGNPCQGCVNGDYYTLGACEEEPLPIVYCDPKPDDFDPNDVMCTMEYNPVCAYLNGSNSGFTAGNPCQACVTSDFYTLGACDDDGGVDEGEQGESGEGEAGNNEEQSLIVYCEKLDLSATDVMCTLQYDPVCAYHFDTDLTSLGTTVGNACQACQQQGFDYYIPGECPDDGNQGEEESGNGEDGGEGGDLVFQCPILDLSATDVVCTLEYDPVCAFHANDLDMNNGVTVGNACQACQQDGYAFYTQGECDGGSGNEEEIILNEEVFPSDAVAVRCEIPDLAATDIACLAIYEPVCAYYFNDTNQANGVTVSNSCHACLLQGYDFYVQGECPNGADNEGIEVEVPVEEQPGNNPSENA